MKETFQITVNGSTKTITSEPERMLLDVLRDDLHLTGTKRGCDIGVCGTCTILMDGRVKRACKVKIRDVAKSKIETIESMERDGELHPIQQAFIDCGAIQCGFCTPGMVMTAKALIDKNPNPTRDEIKKSLIGNLCRCTGYQQIFDAIESAAKKMGNKKA